MPEDPNVLFMMARRAARNKAARRQRVIRAKAAVMDAVSPVVPPPAAPDSATAKNPVQGLFDFGKLSAECEGDLIKEAGLHYALCVSMYGQDIVDPYVDALLEKAAQEARRREMSSIEAQINRIRELIRRIRTGGGGEKTASADGEFIEKLAQITTTSEMLNKYVNQPLFGNSLGGNVAGTALDIGLYFVPGVGMVRTGLDAASDFGNALNPFSKTSWKDRLKYGLSGLANTMWTAAGFFTGGLGTGVGKLLTKGVTKGLGGLQRGAQAVGATRAAGGLGTAGQAVANLPANALKWQQQLGQHTFASSPGKWALGYMSGARTNPYKGAQKFMYGAPRTIIPLGMMMARPTTGEGETLNMAPPPSMWPQRRAAHQAWQSAAPIPGTAWAVQQSRFT